MENVRDPREHYNEEPRNDLFDLMFGFGGFLGLLTLIFAVMVIIKFVIS
ncbi:YqzM family protein [Paenibacillus aurantiacus]|uniref:YqzM family protein n=1 Tax=Paenibacillus aurantiacus TaxID=1936118 RepID=A0ABV5KTF8_9BACL